MLGKVRQVDVFATRPNFQVIFNSADGNEHVVVAEDLRSLLTVEASMLLGKQLAIEYTPGTPNVITRVTLSV